MTDELYWHTGNPSKHGYYLAAWRPLNKLMEKTVASEVWFNPDAHPKWWFSRRYTGDRHYPEPLHHEVVAWMPMPLPPLVSDD